MKQSLKHRGIRKTRLVRETVIGQLFPIFWALCPSFYRFVVIILANKFIVSAITQPKLNKSAKAHKPTSVQTGPAPPFGKCR